MFSFNEIIGLRTMLAGIRIKVKGAEGCNRSTSQTETLSFFSPVSKLTVVFRDKRLLFQASIVAQVSDLPPGQIKISF